MIDPDFVGLAELARQIKQELHGNADREGLIRSILSAQDWDTIVRIKGMIYAYERVLDMMQDIQRKMNEPHRRVG